jgi:hypothetical protein
VSMAHSMLANSLLPCSFWSVISIVLSNITGGHAVSWRVDE